MISVLGPEDLSGGQKITLPVAIVSSKIKISYIFALKQACQTGGPIGCLWRPAVNFLYFEILLNRW